MDRARSLLPYGLLTAYNLAGCLMEHFALFYAWTLIPSDQTAILQHVQYNSGLRAMYVYVVPKIVVTIWTMLLLPEHPRLWWSALCLGISWMSSFLVQVPLQLKVRETGDHAALERLVETTWTRTLAMIAHCGVVAWALFSEKP